MIKRSAYLSLAAGLALAVAGIATPVQAAPTPVISDSGGGQAQVTGTLTGATIDSTNANNPTTITNVNGVVLGTPLALFLHEDITGFTVLTPNTTEITAGTGFKLISDGVSTVRLDFVLTSGTASLAHLNTDGVITAVSGSNNVGGFNFYTLLGGDSSSAIDKAAFPFQKLVGNPGMTTVGSLPVPSLALTELGSVPEPSSMALLGIGMTSFLAFRFFKRSPLA